MARVVIARRREGTVAEMAFAVDTATRQVGIRMSTLFAGLPVLRCRWATVGDAWADRPAGRRFLRQLDVPIDTDPSERLLVPWTGEQRNAMAEGLRGVDPDGTAPEVVLQLTDEQWAAVDRTDPILKWTVHDRPKVAETRWEAQTAGLRRRDVWEQVIADAPARVRNAMRARRDAEAPS